MIKLRNIKIKDGLLYSEIFPEDSTQAGFIVVDPLKKEVIDSRLPNGYEWCVSHVGHAMRFLIRLWQAKAVVPKEKLLMWC